MHFIINWSSPTKALIEQEPLKIVQICDTFIFVILQATHTPKITEFQPQIMELYHFEIEVLLKI